MRRRLTKLLATFFYVGDIPLMPGTVASFVGACLYFLLADHVVFYALLWVMITIVGFFVSDRMEKMLGGKDPACVVIDEVSGVMIAFFLLPLTPAVAFTTFFVFRAFDIFKIYPVHKFEPLKGGVGIMMDDIIAGLYTNIAMQCAVRLAGVV